MFRIDVKTNYQTDLKFYFKVELEKEHSNLTVNEAAKIYAYMLSPYGRERLNLSLPSKRYIDQLIAHRGIKKLVYAYFPLERQEPVKEEFRLDLTKPNQN